MSATKAYYEQFFQEEHHDFVDESSYEDFLRMEREHQQQELNLLEMSVEEHDEEIIVQRSPKTQINWEEKANEFLAGSKTPIRDLPF